MVALGVVGGWVGGVMVVAGKVDWWGGKVVLVGGWVGGVVGVVVGVCVPVCVVGWPRAGGGTVCGGGGGGGSGDIIVLVPIWRVKVNALNSTANGLWDGGGGVVVHGKICLIV